MGNLKLIVVLGCTRRIEIFKKKLKNLHFTLLLGRSYVIITTVMRFKGYGISNTSFSRWFDRLQLQKSLSKRQINLAIAMRVMV